MSDELAKRLYGEVKYSDLLNDVALNDEWLLPTLLTLGATWYKYPGLLNPSNIRGNIKSLRNIGGKVEEWGTPYFKYIGNPQKAINKLKEVQKGFVPNADGKGTDFVWGEYIPPKKQGEKGGGYGLAHIEGRRYEEGKNGSEFLNEIPKIFDTGNQYTKPKHSGRYYVGDGIKEGIIRTDYDGKPWYWLNSFYDLYK